MGNKKNLFTLAYAKKFLNKKGLELFKKNNQIKSNNSFKSLSYTALSSLILIIILLIIKLDPDYVGGYDIEKESLYYIQHRAF